MNNKVKGFTLIELLAVIVILAIIALIITPIITGVIKKAKDSSDLRSAEAYVKAGENYYAKTSTSGGTLDTNVIDDIEVSSKKATDGSSLVVNSDGTTDMAIIIDYKCYRKTFSESIKDIKVTDITNDDDKANCSVPLKSDYAFLNKTTIATETIGNIEYIYSYLFGIDSVGGTKDYYFTSINKVDSAPSTFAYSFDISDKSISDNTSIMAYLVTNGTNSYDVYLVSSKTIAAPADSSYLFTGMALAGDVNLSWLNTYFATNMSHMFDNTGKDKMTSLNLGTNFYTINATDMSSMFLWTGETAMKTLNIGDNFNTSSVLNMSHMFDTTGYKAMTSLDLGSNFNAASATNMTGMFDDTGSTAMTTLNLGANFNAASATDMSQMFLGTGMQGMTTLDLGDNFNASNVTNMREMFWYTGQDNMTTLNLGKNFDTSSVTNMSEMFYGTGYKKLTSLNLGDNFDTSNVTNMSLMFFNFSPYSLSSLNLGNKFYTSSVENMSSAFQYVGEYSKAFTSFSLGDKFNTSNVKTMDSLFNNTGQYLTTLDLGPAFKNIPKTEKCGVFCYVGADNIQIKVSSDIYSDATHFKQNKDSSTTIENPRGTIVSAY